MTETEKVLKAQIDGLQEQLNKAKESQMELNKAAVKNAEITGIALNTLANSIIELNRRIKELENEKV